jgi:TonB family protein
VQVLAQRVPVWHRGSADKPTFPELPAPFGEVARHCLQVKPEQRWTVAEIAARLQGKVPEVKKAAAPVPAIPVPAPAITEVSTASAETPATTKPMAKWMYLAPIGVIAVGGMIWAGSKLLSSHGTGTDAPVAQTARRLEEAAQPPVSTGEAVQNEHAGEAGQSDSGKLVVVHQVVPELSRSSRRTIHGTIKVAVRVEVDAAGNVTRAKLESGRASQYFVRQAVDAARGWKFAPVAAGSTTGTRSCVLRFGFSRRKTEASVEAGRR